MASTKNSRRIRLKKSIRSKISGTAEKPRLSVYRSNKSIYGQVIDDTKGHTLASISSIDAGVSGNVNIESSKEIGKKFGEKVKGAGVNEIIFDRNGYKYHGQVKAFAEGLREAGIKF